MSRLLIISNNYAPEETGIAPYSTALAQHLVRSGYDVTVIAGMPHYPQWRVAPAYGGRPFSSERHNGVDVLRAWQYVPSRQSAPQRALHDITSLFGALQALRIDAPDAVIGVVPPLGGGLLARAAAARFGVPYGLVFQDLVGPGIAQSGVAGGRIASGARALERWAVARASAVAIIAEGFRPYVESLGVPPGRIARVRNWSHVDAPSADRAEMRARLRILEDAFVCMHAGNMGNKQRLENIIECAQLAAGDASSPLFVLMGDGNRRPALESMVAQLRLPNLRMLALQPRETFVDALAAADVLLVNQQASVVDMSLPSKLTSYFAAGRPVVAAVAPSSETAREIVASGAGVVVPADDPTSLLRTLRMFAEQRGLSADLGARGRAYVTRTLSPEACLRGYAPFLDALV
ncbi:MAG TPA: glycosyltransferase, partial [Dehalococcoidia bacterium]